MRRRVSADLQRPGNEDAHGGHMQAEIGCLGQTKSPNVP